MHTEERPRCGMEGDMKARRGSEGQNGRTMSEAQRTRLKARAGRGEAKGKRRKGAGVRGQVECKNTTGGLYHMHRSICYVGARRGITHLQGLFTRREVCSGQWCEAYPQVNL